MSLIKCPECDHNVSSKAPFCPNCGVLIEGNIKRCPVCGGYSLMSATECPHCHTKFAPQSKSTKQEPATTPAASEADKTVATPTPSPTTASSPSATHTPPTPSTPSPEDDNKMLVDPRAQKSKSGGAPWYLLILAIVLIAIGGFFYWENQNQEASEERAYDLLRDCNDPLNYEDFIARYPMSRHMDDVRRRLQELRNEEQLWQQICQQNDVMRFKDFISNHPTSPFKKVALHKIDSLDWREAERLSTFAAYDAYIQHHDNGEYIDQAFTARAAAQQREEQARRDSIAAAEALRRDSIAAAASGNTPPGVVAPI